MGFGDDVPEQDHKGGSPYRSPPKREARKKEKGAAQSETDMGASRTGNARGLARTPTGDDPGELA